MKQRKTHLWLSLLIVLVIVSIGVLIFLYQPQQAVAPKDETIVSVETTGLVEEDWISIEYPKVLSKDAYVLKMDLLSSFETIEILWSHPGNVESESYTLTSFLPQSDTATYNISAVLGNLLPGENSYKIFAKEFAEQDNEEAKNVEFSLQLDVMSLPAVAEQLIDVSGIPETVGSEEVTLEGSLEMSVDRMRVYSFHKDSGKSSFTRLRKFSPADKTFSYNASEKLGNLFFGENTFVFEGLDDSGDVVLRKTSYVNSTRLTLSGEVTQRFGTFSEVKGGWYVSSTKPWFSLRPVYQEVFYQTDEKSVVIPRPTLQYSAESDRSTALCDYFASKDFEEEGMIYRAYSYQACQQYRFGVAVYDRFLSLMTHQPVEVISRLDYKDISTKASTAFVMIETGGMPEERAQVLDLESAEENFDTDEEESDEKEKKYYVFQMLLTEEVEYTDRKIGNIKEEASEERLSEVQDIQEFLTAHGGDRLFTELLFTGIEAVDAE